MKRRLAGGWIAMILWAGAAVAAPPRGVATDAVSRSVILLLDATRRDAVSREVAVYLKQTVPDAVSRELVIALLPRVADAVAREVVVDFGPLPLDAISREVVIDLAPSGREATSREVVIDLRALSVDAVSRELVFELHPLLRDAISRELTFELRPASGDSLPAISTLRVVFPNPFRETTTVRFDVATPARFDLTVHGATGERVRSLLSGEPLDAGVHDVPWDGRNDHGQPVAAGVYFVALRPDSRIGSLRAVRVR
ncbi:MAG: FlgD immunoglobulin-like domain containing protein [bacterium]